MRSSHVTKEVLFYFLQLNEIEQQSVLQLLKTFSTRESKEAFTPDTIEAYNKELEDADAAIEAGDYISHDEVMKSYLKS